MTFSQCLGVIGYSVLPLIVTGLALIVFHSIPVFNTMIKVNNEHFGTKFSACLSLISI